MMQRGAVLLVAVLMIVGGALWLRVNTQPRKAVPVTAATPAAAPSTAMPPTPAWVAAPGRVEPVSEEMRLGFDIAGKLAEVSAEEGDVIKQGQILARLAADEFAARIDAAEQVLAAREAALAKVLAGARDMERREAKAALQEARTVSEVARIEHQRRRQLLAKEVLSQEEADRAEREYKVATDRMDAARQRFRLVDDPAREEDVKRAMAEAAEARARLAEAQALAAKAVIRSPIDGVVLRKHRRAGEMVSVSFDTPVVTVGDISRLRVRADVDERDISRVNPGQKAVFMAEAYGERRFTGTVVRVAKILGKKNIRTDEPAEKNDTRILETLIDVDAPAELPVGLRLDVFILTAPDAEKTLPAYTP
ncbi:HlyD family secretion protein [Desulfovibrio sp. TomC]|uniref:HlyD family secretion protein n=1 Tax=Desulfovibrio sp. TomC TaxID=1562888 RepID=UPI000575832C|nr:HlyD family efflux transporter periplasmic adaptor subunit [Desulfovibrio sp. TomC]KHK01272.1 secretion protein HlyD [Desulfovibrio sp. TomC]